MTTQQLAPAAAPRRRVLPSPPERHVLVPLVIAVTVLLTQGVAQAVTPFIRQDDWPFLLPPDTLGVLPPSYYNDSEGRWKIGGKRHTIYGRANHTASKRLDAAFKLAGTR